MSCRFNMVLAALFSLIAVLLVQPSLLQADPSPSCVGIDACTGNTGAVGAGACVGDSA